MIEIPLSQIDRRTCLKLLVASVVIGPRALQAATSVNASGLELAVQMYSFNRQLRSGELDVLDYPQTVLEGTGIRALEYWNGPLWDHVGSQSYFKKLKKRCDDIGVVNTLILCDSKLALDSPEASMRAKAVESYKVWLEAIYLLGGTTIRIDCKSDGDLEEQKNYAIDGLNSLCDLAGEMGLNIVVENHGNYSSRGDWLADVMKRLNRSNCGTLPDFQNFDDYDPYKGVEELMPFAKMVCAKALDFDTLGNEVNIDYRRMLKIVLDSGYSGYLGIEYEGHGADPITGILKTKRLIEKTLQELG